MGQTTTRMSPTDLSLTDASTAAHPSRAPSEANDAIVPGAVNVTLGERWLVRGAGTVAGLLMLASVGAVLARHYTGHPNIYGLVPLFDLDKEQSIGTWVSSMFLLAIGMGVGVIAAGARQSRSSRWGHWALMAGLFTLMSIDEIAGFHEKMIHPLRELLGAGSIFYYAWVVPGLIFVAGVVIVFWNFNRELPRASRRLLIAGIAVYFTGALGMEMVSGWLASHHDTHLLFAMMATLEESLELAGLVLLLRWMLDAVRGRVTVMRGRLR